MNPLVDIAVIFLSFVTQGPQAVVGPALLVAIAAAPPAQTQAAPTAAADITAPAPLKQAQTPPVAAPPASPAKGKLTGLAAWAALVGNTVTGKSSDDEPLAEYYMKNGTVKQIIGTEVATGKWTVKGLDVCFEFPDDDDATCYKVEVSGNMATFLDEDGAGQRYQILQGNPKGL